MARLQNNTTTAHASSTTSINKEISTGKDAKEDFSEFDLDVDAENVCTGAILADEVSGVFFFLFYLLFYFGSASWYSIPRFTESVFC